MRGHHFRLEVIDRVTGIGPGLEEVPHTVARIESSSRMVISKRSTPPPAWRPHIDTVRQAFSRGVCAASLGNASPTRVVDR